MATMFYQQLINRKTVSSRWPFSNSLARQGGKIRATMRVAWHWQMRRPERDRAGQRARKKEKGYTSSHTFRGESLRALSTSGGKGEIYGPAFVHEWSAHVQEVFKRRVLTSAYLHTSGLRKHLLKLSPPLPSPPRGLSESIRSLRSRFIDRSRIVEQYIARCTRPDRSLMESRPFRSKIFFLRAASLDNTLSFSLLFQRAGGCVSKRGTRSKRTSISLRLCSCVYRAYSRVATSRSTRHVNRSVSRDGEAASRVRGETH